MQHKCYNAHKAFIYITLSYSQKFHMFGRIARITNVSFKI